MGIVRYIKQFGVLRFLDAATMRLLGTRYSKWRSWKRLERRIVDALPVREKE